MYGSVLLSLTSYIVLRHIGHDDLPVHDVPFPAYPGLHVQSKDPSVLLQKAAASQLWTLVIISKRREKRSCLYRPVFMRKLRKVLK